MTDNNDEMLKVGDKVEIHSNARGTVWKTGYIANIDKNGEALINYGDQMFPEYGMGIRKPMSQLRKV